MGVLGGLFLGQASGIASAAIGPAFHQWQSDLRYDLGWNDVASARFQLYKLNQLSTGQPLTFGPGNKAFTSVAMSMGQLIQSFNQAPWPTMGQAGAAADRVWRRMIFNAKKHGVRVATPQVAKDSPASDPYGTEWNRLIDMSSSAAPLGQVVRDYYRSIPFDPPDMAVSTAELNYNLQRAQYRRQEDRDRLLRGYYGFSAADAMHLRWLGLLDDEQFNALLRAAGVVQPADAKYAFWLTQRRPDPQTFIGWATRRIWDDDFAKKWGLDDSFEQSPIAQFFARAEGVGRPSEKLPGQPDGEADWLKLAYRSSRPLIGFSEARQMQHRFRPVRPGSDVSVVPGVKAWTGSDTADMLMHLGMTDPMIQQHLGLVDVPLNIRIINHVLMPIMQHPAFKAQADAVFGEGVDWVKNALLDHGFNDKLAGIASAGIQQQAYDRANEESIAHDKKIRADRLAAELEAYALGTRSPNQVIAAATNEYTDAAQLTAFMGIIETQVVTKMVEAKVKAIHKAWLDGTIAKVNLEPQLLSAGITDARTAQYITQWAWERDERARMLTTKEILDAFKHGLLSEATTLARLANLGWTQTDALVEIAFVEQELVNAAAKANAIAAVKSQAAASKLAKEQATALSKAQAAAAKASKAAAKLTLQEIQAKHKQLRDQSAYFASVHAANARYAAAAKAGNQELMDAELAKEISAYEKWLIQQSNLLAESPEVALEIGGIITTPASGPVQSASATPATSAASPSGSGPGGTNSGGGQPATT